MILRVDFIFSSFELFFYRSGSGPEGGEAPEMRAGLIYYEMLSVVLSGVCTQTGEILTSASFNNVSLASFRFSI